MKRVWIGLILLILIFTAVSCKTENNHASEEEYKSLFHEEDDEDTRNLKNCLIDAVIAYNKGNYKAYFGMFDMEESDLDYNINTAKEMSKTFQMTYEITGIETAFVNPENAQALVVLRSKAVDRNTKETVYYISTEYTYTMQLRDSKWVIFHTEEGSQFDVADLEAMTEQNE